MSIQIRPVESRDYAAITKTYFEAVTNGTASFELVPPTLDEMRVRISALTKRGFPYLVAEGDGVFLGYAYVAPYRTRPAYRWTVENSIYVDPKAQGNGIGKKLLLALIEESTNLGFRQMIGVIGDSNNLASIGVHKACGFELIGTLKAMGWKHEQWLDTVYVQLSLGEGQETAADLESFPGRLFKE